MATYLFVIKDTKAPTIVPPFQEFTNLVLFLQ